MAKQIVTSTQAAAQRYKLGAQAYNPRSTTLQGNAASWQVVQAYLKANGGTATLGALQAHLATKRNHANFAKYAVRRGWLVPAGKATKAAAAKAPSRKRTPRSAAASTPPASTPPAPQAS